MTTVRFSEVTKVFGDEVALENFSLAIHEGELLALLGPSGSGKTTALRVLAGFEQPTSGSVWVGGENVTEQSPQQRNLGMVFQSYSLFPNMTVTENIRFALTLRKWPKGALTDRINEMLDLVRLVKHRDKYPHQLSGGQQQRVALARAVATKPPLLLLDEPLSALDAAVRDKLRDDIRRMQQELGVTALFVTHDQHEAMEIADRIAVMNDGKLVQLGTPREIYSRPNSAFTATFMGQMNRVKVSAEQGTFTLFGRDIPAGSLAHGVAFIRPEKLRVSADSQSSTVVRDIVFLGSISRCVLDTPYGLVTAELPSPEAASLAEGQAVRVELIDRDVLIEAV